MIRTIYSVALILAVAVIMIYGILFHTIATILMVASIIIAYFFGRKGRKVCPT